MHGSLTLWQSCDGFAAMIRWMELGGYRSTESANAARVFVSKAIDTGLRGCGRYHLTGFAAVGSAGIVKRR
jgi:hypothetical protein